MTTSAPDFHIRRIGPSDGPLLRDLRLHSLAEAPEAFGQPVGEAREWPEARWQRTARQSSHGDNRTWLLAEDARGAIGLVQGRKRRPSTLLLFSMWVAPRARRSGVGRALIDELERWARDWHASETILWVYGGNTAALDFYRDLAFEPLRDSEDAESGARFGAVAMRRAITLSGGSGMR